MRRPLLLSLLLALATGCPGEYVPSELPERAPGALQVGAAEGFLELPIGCPQGGFTNRAKLLGNTARVDGRDSDYIVGFGPSTGIQTMPAIKAFWFDNGQENLVNVEVDVIYAYDDLTREITARLEAETGLDLQGRVTLSTSHSHNTFGNFSGQFSYFLGGDRYNHEVFTRYAEQATAVAMEAWEGRQEAAIGIGYFRDWDPTNYVYHDRRGENNELQVWDDLPAGGRKDPILWMMRVDTLAGDPLAVLYGFGIHGTLGDADNSIISVDAPGHLDIGFAEQFDTPVVVAHFQGAGGDASPDSEDRWFARDESVGERAGPMLYAAWQQVPTGTAPVELEARTRAIREHKDDIHVTRDGAVDWTYLPYDEDYEPDLQLYAEDGSLLSPFDEFNCANGAAFCGEDFPYLAGWDIDADIVPYASCTQVDGFPALLQNAFDLPELPELPLKEDLKTVITAATMGPLATLHDDGTQADADLLWAFFPGEVCDYYGEMVRRRAAAELGYDSVVVTGYSQDHEGYLLIAEDWMVGGYEPSINVWGPLQGDWILDQSMLMSQALLTPEIELQDPDGVWAFTEWGPWDMPEHTPDDTPAAGTVLTEPGDYLYCPLYTEDEQQEEGMNPDLSWPTEVPRVQGLLQLAWQGGDPAVDLPRIVLERLEGADWVAVTSASGRVVDSTAPDMLLAHTPNPLTPAEAPQTHTYWAAWQAVGHVRDRAGLPLGDYRLHVSGHRWLGGSVYPFETEPYEIVTEPVTVVPAVLDVAVSGADLSVSLPGPERGFRLVGLGGDARGDNPLPEQRATVTWTFPDGSSASEDLEGTASGGRTVFSGVVPEDVVAIEVLDIYGNVGQLDVGGPE
ncbi:MAG: hypothetical protein ABIO70_06820 [Pseudomonadota bacterium]